MRVIAGSLGGRRLQAPRGRATRPTSDRVREALFAILGDVSGAHVLDVFAGTGALGIEALSRGAACALFLERHPRAIAALEGNLRALGLSPPTAEIRRGEAFTALRAARAAGDKYDLVFIDPPYSRAHDWGPELSAIVPALLGPTARVVVESDRRAPLELRLETLQTRIYGDTSITIQRQQ